MPKRSNEFQRLVALLEAQLAGSNAIIEESKLFTDIDGEQREVDIVVSAQVGQRRIVVGIECRDRSDPRRKADKTWMEQIAGKLEDLPEIHRKVAVSSNGFSKGALKKAARNGIETLTLGEAEEVDWLHSVFSETQALITVVRFVPHGVFINTTRDVQEMEIDPNPRPIYNDQGVAIGEAPFSFLGWLISSLPNTKVIAGPLVEGYDIKTKTFTSGDTNETIIIELGEDLFLDPELSEKILSVEVLFEANSETRHFDVRRFTYGKVQGAEGQIAISGVDLSLALVATKDDQGIALRIRRLLPDGRTQDVSATGHPLPDEGPVHYILYAFG